MLIIDSCKSRLKRTNTYIFIYLRETLTHNLCNGVLIYVNTCINIF